MKIKLISLLIALLCVSVLFVSCSDECTTHLDADGDGICDTEGCEDVVQLPEPEEPNCTNHVDANNDGVCDTENCGVVIITNVIENEVEVLVPIAKEEYVPMVVKPIPADAVVSDYVVLEYVSGVLTLYTHAYTPVDSVKVVETLGNHYYIIKTSAKVSDPVADDPATENTDESKYATRKDTYTLVNDITGFSVELITTDAYDYVEDNAATEGVNEFWSDAPSFDYDEYDEFSIVALDGYYYIYTENYTKINEKGINYSDFDFDYGENNSRIFTIEDTVYVVDEDGNVIYSDDAIFFIDRPEFSAMVANYGVYEQNSTLYFYDLTKWMECTYSYVVKADEFDWFVLQNGKILVQAETLLPNGAVNYDVEIGGNKKDVDYFVVDFATKSATEIEFGYIIDEAMINDGETEYMTDKLENVFAVNTIVDGKVGERLILAVSNDLEIVCDLSSIGAEPVANGLYVKDVYLNGSEYEAVYDASGKFLNYLPEYYYTFDDCIVLGEEFVYTYDLKLKLDLSKYDLVYEADYYFLLKETVKTKTVVGEGESAEEVEVISYNYYYWNTSLEAPKLLFNSNDSISIYDWDDDYFVLSIPTIEVDPETQQKNIVGYTYTIYSSDGATVIYSGASTYDFTTYYIDGERYVTLYVEKTTAIEGGISVTKETFIVNTTAPAPAPAPAA